MGDLLSISSGYLGDSLALTEALEMGKLASQEGFVALELVEAGLNETNLSDQALPSLIAAYKEAMTFGNKALLQKLGPILAREMRSQKEYLDRALLKVSGWKLGGSRFATEAQQFATTPMVISERREAPAVYADQGGMVAAGGRGRVTGRVKNKDEMPSLAKNSPWHENNELWEILQRKIFGSKDASLTRREVDQLVRLMGLKPNMPILDLACGMGRHSLALARQGFQVTGVDRTMAYLDQAKELAAQEGLQIDFVREDMRKFVREDSFQGAILLYTSLGYFEDPNDDLLTLQNIHRSLRQGARLLIDIVGKEIATSNLEAESVWTIDGTTFHERRRLSDNGNSLLSICTVTPKGKKKKKFTTTLRLYSAEHLTALLQAAGFQNIHLYGNLDGDPYSSNAKRLVALARK